MESKALAAERMKKLLVLQEHYADFKLFLSDAMAILGFKTSPVQEDIADYLVHGPDYIMIQAQRSQAKSTVTCIFAVWSLIMQPTTRIMIVTRGEDLSNEASSLILKLILSMPQLECMRPDRRSGDLTSTEAFDIHHSLKGINKSPSVSCVGVTGGMTGKRADILISDDIEDNKNARTAEARAKLMSAMREFEAIVQKGRIIYLGTPHNSDSIYNALPGMGFAIRIWPGRFPTLDQQKNYGDMLAPWILRRIEENPSLMFGGGLLGDRGQVVDPLLVPEPMHIRKEMAGKAYYELQYMLNTALIDADRFPLKPELLVAMPMGATGKLPVTVHRGLTAQQMHKIKVEDWTATVAGVHSVSEVLSEPSSTVMYIDPAPGGANGDASGYAVVSALNSTLFARDWGGVPGGYETDKMRRLARIAIDHRVDEIQIEKNMGYGAFTVVFTPILRAMEQEERDKPGSSYPRDRQIGITEDYVTGQKERRICDTLEPILGRGALVLNLHRLQREEESLQQYEPSKRKTYSVLFQFAKITRERGALAHDDVLDAFEGACRRFQATLAKQQADADAESREAELKKWFENPLGHRIQPVSRGNSAFARSRRK